MDRVDDIRYIQGIGNQAPGGRTAARSHRDIMILRIFNKIPYDQKIVHKTHGGDGVQFIIQAFLQLRRHSLISFPESRHAQFPQIGFRCITLRHIKVRQLIFPKFNLHMTPLCDLVGVFYGFHGIGKKLRHLFRRF